jgi:hypothetical protein
MKQTVLAFILSAFALSFFYSVPAVAQDVAQCIAACKQGGQGGGGGGALCIERCKKSK